MGRADRAGPSVVASLPLQFLCVGSQEIDLDIGIPGFPERPGHLPDFRCPQPVLLFRESRVQKAAVLPGAAVMRHASGGYIRCPSPPVTPPISFSKLSRSGRRRADPNRQAPARHLPDIHGVPSYHDPRCSRSHACALTGSCPGTRRARAIRTVRLEYPEFFSVIQLDRDDGFD